MNVMRCTVVDRRGAVSFVLHGDALPALVRRLELQAAGPLPMDPDPLDQHRLCAAVFGLARHSFMATRVPLAYRARALSLLGGTFRLGMFVGPFIAAALLAIFGTEDAALWFFGICLVATAFLVLLGPDPETRVAAEEARSTGTDASARRAVEDQPAPGAEAADASAADAIDPEGVDREDTGEAVTGSIPTSERAGVVRTMWQNRSVLARLGLAAASLSSVRSARQLVMPLWGLSMALVLPYLSVFMLTQGVHDAQIGLIASVGMVSQVAFGLAGGIITDRLGRRATTA